MSKGLYGALDKSLDSACQGFAFIFKLRELCKSCQSTICHSDPPQAGKELDVTLHDSLNCQVLS